MEELQQAVAAVHVIGERYLAVKEQASGPVASASKSAPAVP